MRRLYKLSLPKFSLAAPKNWVAPNWGGGGCTCPPGPYAYDGDSSNHSFAFIGVPCVNYRTIKIIAWKQAINKNSVLLSSPTQNLWDKQQQARRASFMQNMDVLINLLGIVSGNRPLIIYKITFVWISTPESLVFAHVQQHNEHIRKMKFIIHMHVQKKNNNNNQFWWEPFFHLELC